MAETLRLQQQDNTGMQLGHEVTMLHSPHSDSLSIRGTPHLKPCFNLHMYVSSAGNGP